MIRTWIGGTMPVRGVRQAIARVRMVSAAAHPQVDHQDNHAHDATQIIHKGLKYRDSRAYQLELTGSNPNTRRGRDRIA
jgi:hypothetical protein